MPTRTEIRQKAGELTRLLTFPIPVVTALAVQAVTCESLINTDHDVDKWVGYHLGRYDSDDIDDLVRESSAWTPASGLLTHAGKAYADTSLGTEELEIWDSIDPRNVDAAINRALKKCFRVSEVPLGRIADPDMETIGTDDWADGGSGAAFVKDTTQHYEGDQSLKVTAAGADDWAQPAAGGIPVTPGDEVYMVTICKAVAGDTIRLRARDVTNATVISGVTTTQTEWTVLHQRVTAPAGCLEIMPELVCDGSGDIGYFDQLAVGPVGDSSVFAPSWLTTIQQVVRLQRRVFGASGDPIRESPHWEKLQGDYQQSGALVKVEFQPVASEFVVPYIVAERPYEVMSAEADSRAVQLEWIAEATAMEVWDWMSHHGPSDTRREYENKMEKAAGTRAAYAMREGPQEPHDSPRQRKLFSINTR